MADFDKQSILLYRRSGDVCFYLKSVTFDNEGVSFECCMDPAIAFHFDQSMYISFKKFLCSISDDPFMFVRIFVDEI